VNPGHKHTFSSLSDFSVTSPAVNDVLQYNGSKFVNVQAPAIKFGGTGTDGALAATSGVTTIDLGNAAYFVKNYLSISITGTASLAFINPGANGTIVVLKSQGAVTLTSLTAPMIDCSSLGSAGGTTGVAGS